MKPKKKIIRYRIPVSVKFPATHPRAGEPTDFVKSILTFGKRHTIRANYQLWSKRFEKIERGEAVLELYHWSGKPYASKAVTICQLRKDDGIGIQKLTFDFEKFESPRVWEEDDKSYIVFLGRLASNDGLSFQDFRDWFAGYDMTSEMAIIHFTTFRY